jgi:hypothetical protein
MAFSTSSFERRSRASLRAATFGLLSPATWFSNDFHFQQLAAVKNGGTSLYRYQLAEKQHFSKS